MFLQFVHVKCVGVMYVTIDKRTLVAQVGQHVSVRTYGTRRCYEIKMATEGKGAACT